MAVEQDREEFGSVRALTYNNGDPYPPERLAKLFAPETRSFLAEYNGGIAAICTVLDLTASRGKGVVNCGGVAAVAVLPHLRRSGIGTAMMAWLVRRLKETGTPLASLYAFREPFYRKFGYEVCGRRSKIVCPLNRWPKLESALEARRLGPADWRELVPCYTAFTQSRSGLNLRTELHWRRVLAENRPLTIYAIGDPVEAYAVVSHSAAFWTTDHISEFIWSTRRGYEGLLSMLGGLGINKTALSWFEPSDGPFYGTYLDQGIDVSIERPIMFRVCDVPAALRCLRPDPAFKGDFKLEIDDAVVVENQGPWTVSFAHGVVHVEKASGEPDLRMSVGNFAQAFLGEPSCDNLASIGNLDVLNVQGLTEIRKLMPGQATCCMDFF